MSEPIFIETVTLLPYSNTVQPAGSFFKSLKKAISIKSIKKFATIKNITSVVAGVVLPGAGALLVDAAITASDIAKGQQAKKKIKTAAAAAAKKDAAAVQQIKDGFAALKAESDTFRAARGLSPLNVTLPDITKATPEQIEAAFTALQNDAAAITEAESKGESLPGTTNKTMLYAGAAIVAVGAIYLLTRKRK